MNKITIMKPRSLGVSTWAAERWAKIITEQLARDNMSDHFT